MLRVENLVSDDHRPGSKPSGAGYCRYSSMSTRDRPPGPRSSSCVRAFSTAPSASGRVPSTQLRKARRNPCEWTAARPRRANSVQSPPAPPRSCTGCRRKGRHRSGPGLSATGYQRGILQRGLGGQRSGLHVLRPSGSPSPGQRGKHRFGQRHPVRRHGLWRCPYYPTIRPPPDRSDSAQSRTLSATIRPSDLSDYK